MFPVPPRVSPFAFENNPLYAEQFAQVNCIVAEGDLPLIIEWKFNGESLEKYSEISIAKIGKRSSALSIEAVAYTNVGNYSCEAKNRGGTSIYVTQLQVTGYSFYFLYF